MALAARSLGYRGIIIFSRNPEKLFMPEAAEKVREIEVALGVEASASSARALKSRIGSLRSRYPFLVVQGNSEEAIRMASEDPNVDLLIHPCDGRRPLSIATARSARQNQISIGFDLWPMIHLRGSPRARWMEALRRNLALVRKFHIRPAITAGAVSHLDLRSPRELMALAEVAGFQADEAKEALCQPSRILELNRRRWAAPGVEIL
jgi:ribonuclease P/MRP protein subunit RPP1